MLYSSAGVVSIAVCGVLVVDVANVCDIFVTVMLIVSSVTCCW